MGVPRQRRAVSAGAVLWAALSLAACGVIGRPDDAQHPPQAFAPWSDVVEEYRLRPGDEIDVKLLYNPELSDRVVIAPDGRISMSLIGSLVAEGKTPTALAKELEQRFNVELQRPDVTVIPRSFASNRVFVGGEVGTPGVVNIAGRIGVAEAVLTAGGFRTTAAFDNVVLLRRSPDGRPMLRNVDMAKLLDEGDRSQDVPVQAGDMIFVPRKGIANVNMWVDQYFKQVMPWTMSAGFSANYDMRQLGTSAVTGTP
ncbi:MAG: polysaccharide biosynthesis/export family protein [Alphaproteobacteria bacterium]|nr:polysaccharide biosynthesis/export family protein [Alphaproteobacteria bacterium]